MSGKPLFRALMRLDSGTILPQALRKGGYHTFATGKWHNGELSFENSFDEAEAVFFGGAARSHIGVPVNRMIAGLMVLYDSGESFSTELFADAAIEYIETRAKIDKPFFCYIPVTAPYSPVTPRASGPRCTIPKKSPCCQTMSRCGRISLSRPGVAVDAAEAVGTVAGVGEEMKTPRRRSDPAGLRKILRSDFAPRPSRWPHT